MTTIDPRALDYALSESLGDGRAEVTTTYSGRAMYGDTCLGLILDSDSEWGSILLKLAERDPFAADTLKRPARDSMGMGVVLYWPGVNLGAGEPSKYDTDASDREKEKEQESHVHRLNEEVKNLLSLDMDPEDILGHVEACIASNH